MRGWRKCMGGLGLAAGLLTAPHAVQAAVDEAPPDWTSPKAVMLWAMGLDRAGWDYLGSADDAIYFAQRAKGLPNGHATFALRGEFFNHKQVGRISSSQAVFEVDCPAFRMRRLSSRMLSQHNLKGETLNLDERPTDWFEPPGHLIPAAVTGACLSL